MGSTTRQFQAWWGGTGGSQLMDYQFRIYWTVNETNRTVDVSCAMFAATNPGGDAYGRDIRIDAWRYYKVGNDTEGYAEWGTGGNYYDQTVYNGYVQIGGTGNKTLHYDDNGSVTAYFKVDIHSWNNNYGTHYYLDCNEVYRIQIENIGSASSVVYINGQKYIPYINGSKCEIYINGVKY